MDPFVPTAAARRDFASFYAKASGQEAAALDVLVMVRAALEVGIQAQRGIVPDQLRMGFERTTDSAERAFLAACDVVRATTAFLTLPDAERARIERLAFTVRPAAEG